MGFLQGQSETGSPVTCLSPQITAHVLKRAVLPAAQKTEKSVRSSHPSEPVEPLRAASGEGSNDAQLEGGAHPSCSVKEAPAGYGQETGESGGAVGLGVPGDSATSPARVGTQARVCWSWGLLEGEWVSQVGGGPTRDCRLQSLVPGRAEGRAACLLAVCLAHPEGCPLLAEVGPVKHQH